MRSMVPLTLALKNFLSYGQTTQYIDFQPYHLICLSGKNGHGKSALLDALTWVLWGHARKTQGGARADENLVRLGQTQMMVSLEFLCNNQVYRVRRELNIGSKTHASLDFGIVDPQTGAIRGLTDKTIRATQEKIIATLGLDYESFINSVFLRQGASNEFSKKSPKERKEILSSILGISQFELIKKKAIEKSRLLATQRDTLLPIQQRLSCEITQKEQLTQHLAQAQVQEEQVRTQLQTLQKSEIAHLELQQQHARATQRLTEFTTAHNTAHMQQLHTLELQLQQTTVSIDLARRRLMELQPKITQLQQEIRIKTVVSVTPELFEKYRDRYQAFVAQKNNLAAVIQDYDYRINKLRSSAIAHCPTCAQELTSEKKSTLCAIQLHERAHTQHQLTRLVALLPRLKEKIIAMHTALEQAKEVAVLEKRVQELMHEHELVRQQEVQQLALRDQCTQQKKDLDAQYTHALTRDTTYQQLVEQVNQLTQHIQARGAQQPTSRGDMHALERQHATLLGQIGSYTQQLARLELQEAEFAKLSASIHECSYTHELYQHIAHIVGKDGIQALLIEQALPEIEHEANILLEKLTDGQAHLFIESLRDLKSGKSKETLDIHISDATGIRAYELFSGGEAFRIDFALRIALSKLLARRAGTTLQTLIIDEGFGSQDEEGLAHIMDALYKIQDDFAKIIIVSHLPFMKDHFPVHFVVNKTAQGSSIRVIEQG